jgi:hypothetical protein
MARPGAPRIYKPHEVPAILRPNEVPAILTVPAAALHRLHSGQIPMFRQGQRLIIRDADLGHPWATEPRRREAR